MSEKISIIGIIGRGKHGVLPSEKSEEQEFVVDVTLKAKLLKAAKSDALAETIDYAEIAKLAHQVITGPSVNLVEKLAKEIGDLILENFPKVESAEVTVHKPQAPIPIPFKDVSVTIKSER